MLKIRLANDNLKRFFEMTFATPEELTKYLLDRRHKHIFINEVLEGHDIMMKHFKSLRPSRSAIIRMEELKHG